MPVIYPGQTIGIIGDDRKAYRLAIAAKQMGFRIAALNRGTNAEQTPFLSVVDYPLSGQFNRYADLIALAEVSDVLTYTNELIDETWLEQLTEQYYVPQGSSILSVTQDRYLEKVFLNDLNINIPPYAMVVDGNDVRQNIDAIGYPCVLKPIQKGFGKQYQRYLASSADLNQIETQLQLGAYLLESWIPDAKELAVMVVKEASGQLTVLPVTENQFKNHRLQQSLVPARIDQAVATEVNRLARLIGNQIDYIGAFGIEFFLTPDQNIYVKRIIPTPHETGDVLSQTLNFSQYTYHLKAIAQLAVGASKLQSAGALLNVQVDQLLKIQTQMKIKPDWYFELYFANDSQDRGSITAVGQTLQPLVDGFITTELYEED